MAKLSRSDNCQTAQSAVKFRITQPLAVKTGAPVLQTSRPDA